jgi:DNA-binding PadR family transcriptional regulator
MTPYDLKKAIDRSIGYFWSFPRAQLYVEPERLKELSFLSEEREAEGRRRRVYSITPAGKAALRAWLTSESGAAVELRDPGLLKLFFGPSMAREDVVALARAQAATHRARLGQYERLARDLGSNAQAVFALATLRMGLRYEEQSVAFWEEIAAHPPSLEP